MNQIQNENQYYMDVFYQGIQYLQTSRLDAAKIVFESIPKYAECYAASQFNLAILSAEGHLNNGQVNVNEAMQHLEEAEDNGHPRETAIYENLKKIEDGINALPTFEKILTDRLRDDICKNIYRGGGRDIEVTLYICKYAKSLGKLLSNKYRIYNILEEFCDVIEIVGNREIEFEFAKNVYSKNQKIEQNELVIIRTLVQIYNIFILNQMPIASKIAFYDASNYCGSQMLTDLTDSFNKLKDLIN